MITHKIRGTYIMATQEAVHTLKNRGSPVNIKLLIQERNKGSSLRQLGQMFGVSHEHVRKILAKNGQSRVSLLAENMVAVKLGYPVDWLIQLRKAGVIKPTAPEGHRLYSEEQVRQIPSLIAEMRRCDRCGQPRPLGYRRFCRECSQHRKRHRYWSLSSEEKTGCLRGARHYGK
jgi:transcriptional regulator with XRE-family HTH domain